MSDSHPLIMQLFPLHLLVKYVFNPYPKKRVDRSLCILLFCTEYGCGQVFKNSIDYKNGQLQGCQLSFSNISAMNKVKNAFAARMASSSEIHFTNAAKGLTPANIQMNEACCLYPLMNIFQEKRWAIPKRVPFWYFCIFFTSFFQASL